MIMFVARAQRSAFLSLAGTTRRAASSFHSTNVMQQGQQDVVESKISSASFAKAAHLISRNQPLEVSGPKAFLKYPAKTLSTTRNFSTTTEAVDDEVPIENHIAVMKRQIQRCYRIIS
mmetsp:Transcript_768/g.1837  ORF Transcript_768/g.1837 Transcript_768/m.1837 type:complete len:118 (-) Transcript_768:180-533(-)